MENQHPPLEVVTRSSVNGDMLAVAFSAEGRHLNSHLAVEILGGDGIGLEHLLGVP